MLTPASLREYTGPSAVLDLLRDLGYPIAPVDIDPAEWRRGGVSIPWNGEAHLTLAARMPRFDLFLLTGTVAEEASKKISACIRIRKCVLDIRSVREAIAAAAGCRSRPPDRPRDRPPEPARRG